MFRPWLFLSWFFMLLPFIWSPLAQASQSCPAGSSARKFRGESNEVVVLCQKTGSAGEPDLFLDPKCSAGFSKGCQALELRRISLKRRDELLRRISKGEFSHGRNPVHVLCTEGGGALLYLAIVETGSQMVACRLKDQSLIGVDSLSSL